MRALLQGPYGRAVPPLAPGQAGDGVAAGAFGPQLTALAIFVLCVALVLGATARLAAIEEVEARRQAAEASGRIAAHLVARFAAYRQFLYAITAFASNGADADAARWQRYVDRAGRELSPRDGVLAVGLLHEDRYGGLALRRLSAGPLNEQPTAVSGLGELPQIEAAARRASEFDEPALSAPVRLFATAPANKLEALLLMPMAESGGDGPGQSGSGQAFVAVDFGGVLASGGLADGLRLLDTTSPVSVAVFDAAGDWPRIAGSERSLTLGGRNYHLVLHGPPVHAPAGLSSPIAIFGVGLSALIAWLVYVVGNGRRKALQIETRIDGELRHGETRLALALEATREGVWEWAPDRAELHLNHRARKLLEDLGWAGSATSRAILRALDAPGRRALLASLRGMLEADIALDVEAGGHPRAQVDSRLRIRGKVERSRCGRVTRIVGAVSDVSDLRRREASAEQSRQLLTRVVDALPFAVTVRTSDQGYQVCNRAAMALPGVLALARPGRARSGADELAQAIASGESCVIAGGAGGSREVSLVDADERRRCWSIEQLPIEATHGEAATLSIIHDISATRRRIDDLESSRQWFESLLEALPLGIALFDAKWRILFCNRGFRAMSRQNAASAAADSGAGLGAIVSEATKLAAALCRDGGDSGRIEFDLCGTGGESRRTRLGLVRLPQAAADEGWWLSLEDVSPARDAEAALRTSEGAREVLLQACPDTLLELGADSLVRWGRLAPDASADVFAGGRLEGASLAQLLPAEAAAILLEAVHATLADGSGLRREFAVADGGGTLQSFDAHIVPSTDGGALLVIRTITVQRAAERQLEEKEGLLNALVAAMPDMVWFKDRQGRYRYCNPAFERLAGGRARKLLGCSDHECFTPAMADRFRAADLAAEGSLVPHLQEESLCFPDGSEWHAETLTVAVRDGAGMVCGVLGVARDTSQRRRSEEALRSSEARWQFALEGSGDGLWDWDVGRDEVYYSPRWCEMLGYRHGEIGASLDEWRTRIHPDDRTLVAHAVQDHLEGHAEVYRTEHRMLHRDGGYIWVLDRGRVVERDTDGRPLRVIGTHADITDQRRASAALRESEERFRRLADSAPVLIRMLAADARVTYLNRTWLEFTGTELIDGLGAGWLESVHPEDRVRCAVAEHQGIESQRAFGIEFRLRHRDGDYRWMMATADPILDLDGSLLGFIGSATDVSALKQAEEELRRHRDELSDMVREQTRDLRAAKDAAEAANVAKTSFLANMSHELRTPMHAILSYARLGESRIDRLPQEKLLEYFRRVRQSGERLLDLLNDLLDLAKLESGRMMLQFSSHDLAEIVADALDEYGVLLSSHELDADLDRAPPLPIRCDPMRTGQVVRNLLSNAARFTPAGGRIRITLDCVERSCSHRGDTIGATHFARLVVVDNGVGIPHDELELIFEKFVQSSETKCGAGGTGLGLAISREIVEAQGGVIFASNEARGGARFELMLPLEHAATAVEQGT
ncbi:MAG: PAS domain S-box protein [Rhodocyclaceae bacterium]|nr:PAS domain S-box protein [Rhodocyclaceae bacterium]